MNKKNIEHCFNEVVDRYINFFKTVEDEYLGTRFRHKGCFRRVLNNLLKINNPTKNIGQERIIVSEDISPSQAWALTRSLIWLYNRLGGATSHFVIMSRSLKIPAVVGSQCEHERE